ncbi:hypothetical protein [Micromonospora radicis]|uniref:DUF3105 domain-containing protein n=1 Tax=Micromonospora radicis TaxID=1894971 RepID=A0A418MZJ9_9ACTN|nr:hypothetical protein [Micromonospora radicis]RIV40239.1 hypothetical protein D2L64_05120 [Micromonospora radicis]
MVSRADLAGWLRHRYLWAAVTLLAVSITAVALVRSADSKAQPADLRAQVTTWMRTTLEQADPEQHQHAGHDVPQTGTEEQTEPAVICGVHVYGYEPAAADTLADVRTVYGFHLCGIAEQKRPWDWAVKLAGPVIMDPSTDPPGIQVVEATEDVIFVDRLREMFPTQYAEPALKEALDPSEMAELRRRYEAAAGL